MSAPEMVSVVEAARRLGVTSRTIYNRINSGNLDAYRIGRVIRVSVGSIERYLGECYIEPGALAHLCEFPREDGQ